MTTKYSKVKRIIEENTHLTNAELAKKIGRNISWIKTFKAFMNAEDKHKFKDTKNKMYKAIYNTWINDIEAQTEYEENELCKFKLKQREREIKELKEKLQKCKGIESELIKIKNIKADEIMEKAKEICRQEKNKLTQQIKDLENELNRVYYMEDMEKQDTKNKLIKIIIFLFILLTAFFILLKVK